MTRILPPAFETLEQRKLLSGTAALSDLTLFDRLGTGVDSIGTAPKGSMVQDAAGNLFGTNNTGGSQGEGTLWEIAKGTNVPVVKATFDLSMGQPNSQLVLDSSGNIYGVTAADQTSETLWEWSRGDVSVTALASTVGYGATAADLGMIGLVCDSQGHFFGTNSYQGLFEWSAGQQNLTTVAAINDSNGFGEALGMLAIDTSGDVFGTAERKVWEYSGGTTHVLGKPADIGNEILSNTGLTIDSAGNLYGTAESTGKGATLFTTSAASTKLTAVLTLGSSMFYAKTAPLLLDDSHLLDTGSGLDGKSTLFECDLTAKTVTILGAFSAITGGEPLGGLLVSNQITTGSNGFSGLNVYGLDGTYNGGSGIFVYGAVDVSAAPQAVATHLVFAQPPSDVTANGVAMTPAPIVYVEDANGNIVLSDNSIIILNVTASFGPASIDGPFTATAVNGVATFSNVALTNATTFDFSDELIATDGALASADASFNVRIPGDTGTHGNSSLVPDLVKSSLQELLVTGEKLRGAVTLSITNSSDQRINGKDSISLYASVDGFANANSELIHQVFRHLSLAPNASAKVTIPANRIVLPRGTYGLVALVTDPVGETKSQFTGTYFNVGTPYIKIGAGLGPVTPTVIKPGRSGQFKVTLTGLGNTDSVGRATFAIGLSTDGDTLAVPLTTVTKAVTVKAGKSVSFMLHFKVPKGSVAAGSYFPIVNFTQGGSALTIPGSVAFTISN